MRSSRVGKTTLLASLISDLSPRYRVGYLKHGPHSFVMDREGKDTWRARASDAAKSFIEDDERFDCVGSPTADPVLASVLRQDVDILLVEGFGQIHDRFLDIGPMGGDPLSDACPPRSGMLRSRLRSAF